MAKMKRIGIVVPDYTPPDTISTLTSALKLYKLTEKFKEFEPHLLIVGSGYEPLKSSLEKIFKKYKIRAHLSTFSQNTLENLEEAKNLGERIGIDEYWLVQKVTQIPKTKIFVKKFLPNSRFFREEKIRIKDLFKYFGWELVATGLDLFLYKFPSLRKSFNLLKQKSEKLICFYL